MIPKGWKPGWPKWKTEARSMAVRAGARFLPKIRDVKEDPTIQLVIVGNGTNKLPTYYTRPIRRDKDGNRIGPTLPWRKVDL